MALSETGQLFSDATDEQLDTALDNVVKGTFAYTMNGPDAIAPFTIGDLGKVSVAVFEQNVVRGRLSEARAIYDFVNTLLNGALVSFDDARARVLLSTLDESDIN